MSVDIKKLERNITLFNLFSLNKGLVFSLPIFALYFKENGLTHLQILLIFSIQAAMQVICEIPSGVLADYLGRKKVLIAFALSRVTMFAFFVFGDGFLWFAIGGVFFGIALACESGTNSAFLYDTLKALGRESEYKKIFGRAHSYTFAAVAIGGFLGGFLGEVFLRLPLIVTLVILLPLPIIGCFFTEPPQSRPSHDAKYLTHLKVAINEAISNEQIRNIIILWSLVVCGMLGSFPLLQIYMSDVEIPVKFFGVIYLVWLLTSALASNYAHAISNKIGMTASMILLPVFIGIPLIIAGLTPTVFIILLVIFMEFVYGFKDPVLTDEINKLVESHHRATMLSLKGFVQNLSFVIISPIFGYLADLYSVQTAYLIEGIILLPLGIYFAVRVRGIWISL